MNRICNAYCSPPALLPGNEAHLGISISMQESKRSAKDLCGRTDGNMKVIFPKEDVAVQPSALDTASVHAGDYVLVKVGFSTNTQPSHVVLFFINHPAFTGYFPTPASLNRSDVVFLIFT